MAGDGAVHAFVSAAQRALQRAPHPLTLVMCSRMVICSTTAYACLFSLQILYAALACVTCCPLLVF